MLASYSIAAKVFDYLEITSVYIKRNCEAPIGMRFVTVDTFYVNTLSVKEYLIVLCLYFSEAYLFVNIVIMCCNSEIIKISLTYVPKLYIIKLYSANDNFRILFKRGFLFYLKYLNLINAIIASSPSRYVIFFPSSEPLPL